MARRPSPPDLDDTALDEIAGVALMSGIDGLIVSNTTIARPPLKSRHRDEAGGLSGAPLFDLSTQMLRRFAEAAAGRLAQVGVGRNRSGAAADAKQRAGAPALER